VGGLQLSSVQKDHIRIDTLAALQQPEHDMIVTACPLCKKTLSKGADTEVKDIAEVVVAGMK
jgi:Fe-S oxidoreductase